jgi:hypothetical protein
VNRIWAYYANGGLRNVGAYLARLDIGAFNAKAPPRKSPVFWDTELADMLDDLGWCAPKCLKKLERSTSLIWDLTTCPVHDVRTRRGTGCAHSGSPVTPR